ncbi:MAG: toxin-antitoxin system protein [Lachnospiraceae bacterium]|nr:toxin-antitoxin system protein [Lachnospiraceae bacterium]
MKMIHAEYNPKCNSIDINHYEGYIIRIDCDRAEKGLKIMPVHEGIPNALAIDYPLEYVVM